MVATSPTSSDHANIEKAILTTILDDIDSKEPEKSKIQHLSLNKNGILFSALNTCAWILESTLHTLTAILFKKENNPYLTGNFAPTPSEIFASESELQVIGSLPATLSGSYLRNGPDPYFPILGSYHWFDGDGKIHAVRIKNGKAVSYTSRWVETARLKEEKFAGYATAGKIGDAKGLSGLLHLLWSHFKIKIGLLDASHGLGTANTAIIFHAQRLFALHEGDAPYWIRLACDGFLSTIQRHTFDSRLHHAFTAHPKIDPITKEMIAFGYSVRDAPYCWVYQCDKDGEMITQYPVPLDQPVMMHDFAITEKHIILIAPPLVFSPETMIKKGTLPFVFDTQRSTRFGVLPRDACSADDIVWFSIDDACMIFHVANAWERKKENSTTINGSDNNNDDIIELYCCVFYEFSLDSMVMPSKRAEPKLTRVLLNMTTGEATTQQLCSLTGDFPTIPASRVGYPTKYTYLATFEVDKKNKGTPSFYGAAKIDLTAASEEESVVGLIKHGHGRYGGECYFVPKNGSEGDEDDGYLMTYVYDEESDKSELVVYDAKTMASDPVARVLLPHRVPFGFHGYWMTEEQMQMQQAQKN